MTDVDLVKSVTNSYSNVGQIVNASGVIGMITILLNASFLLKNDSRIVALIVFVSISIAAKLVVVLLQAYFAGSTFKRDNQHAIYKIIMGCIAVFAVVDVVSSAVVLGLNTILLNATK
jgi:hypothetical protein